MRVLFCKIACPGSVCFCKPSPTIYAPPSPLRLDTAPSNASSDTSSDPETTPVIEGESESQINGKQSNGDLKSSIKRHGSQELEKKRVQWLDATGKQLAEVREFESSEREDVDSGYYSSRACLCTIL